MQQEEAERQGLLRASRPPGAVQTNGIPFWESCTTHFRTYFSGDWDVDWGYDLDFDPWPFLPVCVSSKGMRDWATCSRWETLIFVGAKLDPLANSPCSRIPASCVEVPHVGWPMAACNTKVHASCFHG